MYISSSAPPPPAILLSASTSLQYAATFTKSTASTTHITTSTSSSLGTPSPTHSPGPSLGLTPENWNSFIGIITAIVGNVLISFALNMQRYAHLRLAREHDRMMAWRKEQTSKYRHQYGSGVGRGKGRNLEASESDPLLPKGSANGGASRSTEHNVNMDGIIEEQESDAVKKDDDEMQEDDSREGSIASSYRQKSYLRSPYWWAGIILMTCGEAGNFLAYGFAPASIVSPLGVVALISNCIIAPLMLKEPYRKRDGLGVVIAVGGAVTVVLSASDDNPKLGPDEIWKLIGTWEFETYFGITVGVIAMLMAASNRFGGKSILIDLGLVGLFGGYTALSTKGVASMLSYTLWRAITFPVTYLLVAILVGTAVMQIKYVNRALQRFDATQVIPVQFVLFTLSVILGSAVLYRDFERTSGEDAGKFVGGCALTFLGVWLITSGRRRTGAGEEARDPEPEDAIHLAHGDHYHDDTDVASEHEQSASRRSSTLRPVSPQHDIHHSRPSTREISQPSTPNITFTPGSPTTYFTAAANMTPTDPAQIAESENPWENETLEASPSLRPRARPTNEIDRYSVPVLPSQLTSGSGQQPSLSTPDLGITNRPRTPISRNISDSAAIATSSTSALTPRLRKVGTAERLSAGLGPYPAASLAAARHSFTGPLLASPLSSGLSAMVADLKRSNSIRSSTQSHGQGSFYKDRQSSNEDDARRRQSVLGIGAGEIDSHGEFGSMRSEGSPLDRRRTVDESGGASAAAASSRSRRGEGGRMSRPRGLSGTLGDLIRSWSGRSDGRSRRGSREEESGGGDGADR